MEKSPPLRLALHEAGHAVMHVFLRLDNLDAISIEPKQGAGGCDIRCFFPPADDRDLPLFLKAGIQYRKRLFVVRAGAEAELLYPHARQSRDSSDILDYAIPLLKVIYGEDEGPRRLLSYYEGVVGGRVRRLIRGKLREPITRFADILCDRTTINRNEAEKIICGILKINREEYWSRPRRRYARVKLGLDLPD